MARNRGGGSCLGELLQAVGTNIFAIAGPTSRGSALSETLPTPLVRAKCWFGFYERHHSVQLDSSPPLHSSSLFSFMNSQSGSRHRKPWFAIQLTTNPLDGGGLKRLCHGRTERFVPALAATKRNLNSSRFRSCLGVRRTLRHQLRLTRCGSSWPHH